MHQRSSPHHYKLYVYSHAGGVAVTYNFACVAMVSAKYAHDERGLSSYLYRGEIDRTLGLDVSWPFLYSLERGILYSLVLVPGLSLAGLSLAGA